MDTAQRGAESNGYTEDTPQDQSRTARTPLNITPALQMTWDLQICKNAAVQQQSELKAHNLLKPTTQKDSPSPAVSTTVVYSRI